MSTTVIFSNSGDTDTRVLVNLWKDLPNVNLIEAKRLHQAHDEIYNLRQEIGRALEAEDDTIIACGHGSPSGLFNPNWTKHNWPYLIDKWNWPKVHCKRFIGIWCYASKFAESVRAKDGFFSSMFISNKLEATMNRCYKATSQEITEQEILFCLRVNRLIKANIPMEKWVPALNKVADKSIDIVKFNYEGLKYYG